MAINETLIHHASDRIDWIDASGNAAHRPLVQEPLQLQIESKPRDLKLVSAKGRTRLWRSQPSDLHRVVDGEASEADKAYPTTASFDLSGSIIDPQRRFNPRQFSLSAGNAAGHQVELFRSPMGSRFASAGGLRGNVRFDAATPASWALLSIEVTVLEVEGSPELTQKISFRAQADKHGDFVIAMDSLPMIANDAPQQTYPAVLSATALMGAVGSDIADPDQFTAAELGDTQLAATFASTIDLTVSPGTVDSLTSKDMDHLVLRIP